MIDTRSRLATVKIPIEGILSSLRDDGIFQLFSGSDPNWPFLCAIQNFREFTEQDKECRGQFSK